MIQIFENFHILAQKSKLYFKKAKQTMIKFQIFVKPSFKLLQTSKIVIIENLTFLTSVTMLCPVFRDIIIKVLKVQSRSKC